MADEPGDYVPEWVEVLGRGPIRVLDDTTEESLSEEMSGRLIALLAAHNGLQPDAEGWRQLALELALKYEPAFQIETPVDRESIGGRPVGWESFVLRMQMQGEMKKGKSQAEAARAISRQSRGRISAKTAQNMMSRKAPAPDDARRWKYEWKADRAMRMAARKLSQE